MTYKEAHDRLSAIKLQFLAMSASQLSSKEARKMEKEAERLMKDMKRMREAIGPRTFEMSSFLKWACFASVLIGYGILIYSIWAILSGKWR